MKMDLEMRFGFQFGNEIENEFRNGNEERIGNEHESYRGNELEMNSEGGNLLWNCTENLLRNNHNYKHKKIWDLSRFQQNNSINPIFSIAETTTMQTISPYLILNGIFSADSEVTLT